jgi:lipopolysaccharide export LptBFGC system permease protein LptF
MFSLVIYDIYYYLLTQKAGDCDFFFLWADNQMTSYEKRLEEHMRDIEEGRRADIEKVEKMTMANIDRLEKLIETRHNEQYERLRLELGLNRKMFWAAVVVIILGIVIYFSSYSSSEVSYLMLE